MYKHFEIINMKFNNFKRKWSVSWTRYFIIEFLTFQNQIVCTYCVIVVIREYIQMYECPHEHMHILKTRTHVQCTFVHVCYK